LAAQAPRFSAETFRGAIRKVVSEFLENRR